MPNFDLNTKTAHCTSHWDAYEAYEDYFRTVILKGRRRGQLQANDARFNEIARNDAERRQFCGGTHEDIVTASEGNFDMDRFFRAGEELQGFMEKCEAHLLPLGVKRRRTLSEHDGELDFDRLYERQPFNSTRRDTPNYERIITLNVEFSFSAGVDAEYIAEFGYFAWAVAFRLESIGIQTNVNLVDRGDFQGSGPVRTFDVFLNLKRAGDYTSIYDIARCFTPNFFRRCIFNMIVRAGDGFKTVVPEGLGRPTAKESSSEPGVINLGIGQMNDFKLNFEKFASFLDEALGLKKGTSQPQPDPKAAEDEALRAKVEYLRQKEKEIAEAASITGMWKMIYGAEPEPPKPVKQAQIRRGIKMPGTGTVPPWEEIKPWGKQRKF